MPTWLIVLLSILSLLLLDATLGRRLLGAYTSTFTRNPVAGMKPTNWTSGGPDRHLLVYLPGTLADGVESINEIEPILKSRVSRVLRVSYGFWRFMPERVLTGLILHIQRHGALYDHITIVGSSMGTKLGTQLTQALRSEQLAWSPQSIDFIMVDAPPSSAYFAEPGRTTSRILRWIYAGPLVSFIVDPILRFGLVPPKDVNIEDKLDHDEVKAKALARMAKFHFTAICDQQRFLSTGQINWEALKDVNIVYLACTLNNETVIQPDAAIEIERQVGRRSTSFRQFDIDSTHCGFLERPNTWLTAMARALEHLQTKSSMK